MSKNSLRVAIVGGGIGGVAAANALLQRGIERSPLRAGARADRGRRRRRDSSPTACACCGGSASATSWLRWGARWVDPQFRRADGSLSPRRCGRRSWRAQIEFYGMHRADLLAMFVDRLPADVVHTGHRCVGFEQDDAAGHPRVRQRRARRRPTSWSRRTASIRPFSSSWSPRPPPLPSGSVAYRGRDPGGERLLAGGRDAQLAGRRASISWSIRCAPASS